MIQKKRTIKILTSCSQFTEHFILFRPLCSLATFQSSEQEDRAHLMSKQEAGQREKEEVELIFQCCTSNKADQSQTLGTEIHV